MDSGLPPLVWELRMYADFSRIRNADLGRFTIGRLVTVLNRLNQHVEIKVTPFRGRRLKTA